MTNAIFASMFPFLGLRLIFFVRYRHTNGRGCAEILLDGPLIMNHRIITRFQCSRDLGMGGELKFLFSLSSFQD